MTLCLDTTTAVDLLRRRGAVDVRHRFEAEVQSGRRLVVSTVVLHELSFGAVRSGAPATKLSDINDLLTRLELIPFEAQDAHASVSIRAELEQSRNSIGIPDLFIASQAIARNWIIVTSNIRHFGRIGGLPLIDWRISERPLTAEQIAARLV